MHVMKGMPSCLSNIDVFISDHTMKRPLLLLLCRAEGCGYRHRNACCHLGPCLPAACTVVGPCLCLLPLLCLPQTLPLLPVSQLLPLPRLLRPLLVRLLLQRLALLLPTLSGLVGGTSKPPVTKGMLQWLMLIETL